MLQSGYMKMIMVDGFNSGEWKSIEVRSWLEDSSRGKERTFFQAYNGDIVLKITDAGYQIIDK